MKKSFLFLALLVTITVATQAQEHMSSKSTSISIGVDAGIPTTKGYSFLIGGSLEGDFKVAPDLALTLSGGYQSWQIKKDLGGGSFGLIPILGGIKYYITPVVYGSGQLGISFSTESGGGSLFTYAPGIGFKIADNFDILAKYTGMSNNGSIGSAGVRLAYSF